MQLNDETLAEAVELRNRHPSTASAARELGIAVETLKNRLKSAAARGMMGTEPVLEGFQIARISTQRNAVGETEREWLTQRPEATGPWRVPEGHTIKGVSALVDESGQVRQQWYKTSADAEATVSAIYTVVDELKKELPRIAPTEGPSHSSELLLNQYTITDNHFGMLAWAEETGDADYDLKIAEQLLLDWFAAAIAMAPNAETGVLAQLGDFMHHDALESVTPAHKHVLDADSRLQKIIRIVIRVVRQIISMLLEKHPRVHVIMASANHDPASSAWMRELLFAMYEDEPRITVDRSPDVYYAFEWGKTALFYHHGHKRKVANVDSVFAGKFREMFGRCPFAYSHLGHLHNDEMRESNLMKVERHRTLAPSDAYASSGGWLSGRDAKVITYHKEFGEVCRSIISPQMLRAKEQA